MPVQHRLGLSIKMVPLKILLSGFLLLLPPNIYARKWNDTGQGTVIFEEAWTIPELIFQQELDAPPLGMSLDQLKANILDIHNQRLSAMDANGVDFMVLSCAPPCVQGFSDPDEAASLATKVNDALAAAISNNTMRFGGFATLSMHDPAAAAAELKRTVEDLGFLGVLLNDYQQSGPDNTTLLFYDTSEYDVFWAMAESLDVPVYLHPRFPITQIVTLEYAHSPFILGPDQQFTVSLSNHIMGIIANGIFDRFPGLKLVVGHSGERITSDLFRIDEQIARQRPFGLPMLKNVSDYWRSNIFETTSGNFYTALLKFHAEVIGLDRIMYSVDYPFLSMSEGAAWVDSLPLTPEEKLKFGRESAIGLLGLNK